MSKSKPKPTKCRWTHDSKHDYYSTACGDAFIMTVDSPTENGYKFCPACGKRIEQEKRAWTYSGDLRTWPAGWIEPKPVKKKRKVKK